MEFDYKQIGANWASKAGVLVFTDGQTKGNLHGLLAANLNSNCVIADRPHQLVFRTRDTPHLGNYNTRSVISD
jgi:hypothetical protein